MHVLNGRGSHSFGSGSGAAVRMPAASIEQVLEQLDGIVRTAHATGSRLGYFAALRRFGASSSVSFRSPLQRVSVRRPERSEEVLGGVRPDTTGGRLG
jgi:hypothetical protein